MNKYKEERTRQLGMNPSTASARLLKDIIYQYAVVDHDVKCHRCGEEMSREAFSIEHKVPWLHSENPHELYFDLENISFSHLSCNVRSARKPSKKYHTDRERMDAHNLQRRVSREKISKEVLKAKRREKYLRTGT